MKGDNQNRLTFYIGYCPKDIAHNLAPFLDNKSVFTENNLIYGTTGGKTQLELTLNLHSDLLESYDI